MGRPKKHTSTDRVIEFRKHNGGRVTIQIMASDRDLFLDHSAKVTGLGKAPAYQLFSAFLETIGLKPKSLEPVGPAPRPTKRKPKVQGALSASIPQTETEPQAARPAVEVSRVSRNGQSGLPDMNESVSTDLVSSALNLPSELPDYLHHNLSRTADVSTISSTKDAIVGHAISSGDTLFHETPSAADGDKASSQDSRCGEDAAHGSPATLISTAGRESMECQSEIAAGRPEGAVSKSPHASVLELSPVSADFPSFAGLPFQACLLPVRWEIWDDLVYGLAENGEFYFAKNPRLAPELWNHVRSQASKRPLYVWGDEDVIVWRPKSSGKVIQLHGVMMVLIDAARDAVATTEPSGGNFTALS